MIGRKVFLNGSSTASESQHFVYDGGEIVLTLQDNGAVANRYLWGRQSTNSWPKKIALAQRIGRSPITWANVGN